MRPAAAAIALTVVTLYAWLLYLFFTYVWPRLPPLVAMLLFMVITLLAVLSPIVALLRLGEIRRRSDESQ